MVTDVTKCLPEITWQMTRDLEVGANVELEQLLCRSAQAVAGSGAETDSESAATSVTLRDREEVPFLSAGRPWR